MHCYHIDDASRLEIEQNLRQAGSQLISTKWQTYIQYHYQSIFPRSSAQSLALLPLFSVVSLGKDQTFIITEVDELVSDNSFSFKVPVCDVAAMNSQWFEKISLFNLKNKKQKRIVFEFQIFRSNDQDIYLADNLVVFHHGINPSLLPKFVTQGPETGRFMRSLDVELGSKRPKTHTDQQRFAFWVYSYAKLKDEITIPPIRSRQDLVKFNECLFAKNFRLV